MPEIQKELIGKRAANSKTFDIGNGKRQLVVSIGDVHYKDNYADKSEQWKYIDLTWEGNRITKAPYELTLDGNKLTIKDKKSGEVSTIELLESKPAGLKWEIVPDYTRVSFRHILPSDKVPFEAKFKVTGNIRTRAWDDEGEIELETSLVDGILTEKLSEVRDKDTGKVRPAKGNIRIDPTWQVGVSSDDCMRWIQTNGWSLLDDKIRVGGHSDFNKRHGGGMRFTNITIPQGATIENGTHLALRCQTSNGINTVRTRISAEDVDDAITFADDSSAFDTRWANRDVSAIVAWDGIASWTLDVDYDSPEIKTVIQARVDSPTWAEGAIVIFWEDFDGRSSEVSTCYRYAYSQDGSAEFAPKLVIVYTVPAGLENKSANMAAKLMAAGLI